MSLSYSHNAIKDALKNPAASISDSSIAGTYCKLRMTLERCASTGLLKGKVMVLHPVSLTVEEERMVTELNNGLNAHAPPPEIMMAEMPTEDQTADLFRLCEEQRLCFRIIIRTLKAEKEGKSVQQLRMCIMGQAGTGKSEIMNAVIWHSFQHEMNRLIGASACFWKAACLVRTANTQAVSCCCFFGINNFQKHLVPGSSELSRLYFTEDVKLLFIDEFGTLSLPFLAVSVKKSIRVKVS
jgi:hypothetical protein